jgi:four helix bundle protein
MPRSSRSNSIRSPIYGEFGKDFGFKDQVRRAVVSIASNIAERKENETVAEFIRDLSLAKESAGELKTEVLIAEDVGM